MIIDNSLIIHLIVGLLKLTLHKMNQRFPKPHKSFERDITVKVDLSNYATKTNLRNTTGADTSKLASKSDLASLKAEADKGDIDKVKTVPVDLSKLSNVVNNDVVKKTVHNKLVAKENNTGTSGFVLKTKYDTDKSDLEKEITGTEKNFLIIVDLLKKPIIMLKLLKQRVKYLALVVQLLMLH